MDGCSQEDARGEIGEAKQVCKDGIQDHGNCRQHGDADHHECHLPLRFFGARPPQHGCNGHRRRRTAYRDGTSRQGPEARVLTEETGRKQAEGNRCCHRGYHEENQAESQITDQRGADAKPEQRHPRPQKVARGKIQPRSSPGIVRQEVKGEADQDRQQHRWRIVMLGEKRGGERDQNGNRDATEIPAPGVMDASHEQGQSQFLPAKRPSMPRE